MKPLLSILIFISAASVFAQQDTAQHLTRNKILTVKEFMEIVLDHHPVAMQARLNRDNADAEKLKAKGSFDPQLYSQVRQKYFDEKTYYRLHNSGLHIPTWFGASAKAGFEQNEGVFLDNQKTVPPGGLWFAELSLPLGKGLFIDKRRAMLKKADLMQEAANFEVQVELNDLFQKALNVYWEWYRSYHVNLIFEEGVNLARTRFEAVRNNATVGEQPLIDTLEAYIQYQNRLLRLQESQVDLAHSRQNLETFLWLEGQVPLELNQGTSPERKREFQDIGLSYDWVDNHPLLNSYNIKLKQLEVEQKLNREQLKPQLDIHYRFLNEAVPRESFISQYSINNYRWGVSASFPIFLRSERGNIRLTELKIRNTQYEQLLKQREIQNKVQALQSEFQITRKQLAETQRIANNYERLLQGEILKFETGESSLFLINQREIKYLESKEKILELEAKLHQLKAKLLSTAGQLYEGEVVE